MDPEKKSLNFIFPTKYVIPTSLKFGHWLSEKRRKNNTKQKQKSKAKVLKTRDFAQVFSIQASSDVGLVGCLDAEGVRHGNTLRDQLT